VGLQLARASVLSISLFTWVVPSSAERSVPTRAHSVIPLSADLWSEPADLERRDLSIGPWGAERAPDPRDRFQFVRPKRHGSSPGLVVRDGRGRTWHVKQGREAQPEVVVSRVLSAVGYRQPPVYFVPSFTLADAQGIHDTPGGRFRLSDPSMADLGEWQWGNNPFTGSTPYSGLLVMLVLFNSADLKNSNNSMYAVVAPDGSVRRWFVVRDLGTSLGATGRFDPTPNDVGVFERRRFITGVIHGYVEFGDYHAVHSDLLVGRITPDDVRWACGLLGRLSERQWHDAFRGAGYEPATAARFVRRIVHKIDEGRALGSSSFRTSARVLR